MAEAGGGGGPLGRDEPPQPVPRPVPRPPRRPPRAVRLRVSRQQTASIIRQILVSLRHFPSVATRAAEQRRSWRGKRKCGPRRAAKMRTKKAPQRALKTNLAVPRQAAD